MSWLQRLLPALGKHGIDAQCLFFMHWGDSGPALDSLRADGIPCRAVPCHETTEERIRWTLEQLRDDPPDVFVPNLVVAAYYASRWVRRSGIATVGVLHSDDPFYAGLQDEFVFGRPEFRLSGLACVSHAIHDQMKARSIPETFVERIPYGVQMPAESVARVPGRLRIAYVGRFSQEQKRILEVTAALCTVTDELSGVEAVLYGDGPEREAVERILTEWGNNPAVQIGGRIDNALMQTELLNCDVIVLLSDYEGLPIALLEAMACGCVPVCSPMRSGIPELVQDGVNGLLVSDRGPGFVAAIRRLRDEPGLLDRLSRAARATVSDRYSHDQSTAQWAHLLKHLGSSARPRQPVAIPSRLRLPPVHPDLKSADLRQVVLPTHVRYYRTSRRWLGRVKLALRRTAA